MRVFFVLALILVKNVICYNFLVYCPLFGHSHTKFFATIADSLTDGGHNVTFFTPTCVKKFRNIQYTKSTKHVVHLEPNEELSNVAAIFENNDISRFWIDEPSIYESIPLHKLFVQLFEKQTEALAERLDVLDELKKKKFDLIIFESFLLSAYPLMEYLEIPSFIPSLSLTHDFTLSALIGEPVMTSFVSDVLSPFDDKMNIVERTINTVIKPIFTFFIGSPNLKSFRKPFKKINYEEITPNAPFVFTNSNPFIDFPRPTLAKTIQIGGISVDLEKIQRNSLPEEYNQILNLRPHTFLISFGSVMFSKDMPMPYKKSLVTAIKSLPNVTFIWKFETDEIDFAENAENIIFKKWVPQASLLDDSRLSAFLTHAGLGSVNEVSYLGKPTILCPIFADQPRNAKMLSRHNGSIEISKHDLNSPEKIEKAFKAILFDEKYKIMAEKLARQLQKQPIKPKNLLIKHAEFAAEFGKLPSLDPQSRHISFISYFLLDIIFIFLICSFFIFYISYLIVKFLGRRLFLSKKQKVA